MSLSSPDRKWLVDALSRAVSIPTFGGQEDNLVGFIETLLPPGATIQKQRVEKNRHNLLVIPRGTDPEKARIGLFGHMDTVPPANPGMLEPRLENGTLHGLGACDMKSSIVAYFYLLRKQKLDGSVIVLTVDEETEMKGARMLVEHRNDLLPSLEYAILGEPTNLEIARGHKGVVHTRITIKGRQGHASKPEEAVNPILLAARFILEFNKRYKPVEGRLGRETFSFTRIVAGSSLNVIPGECHVYTDIRTNENTSLSEIDRLVESLGGRQETLTLFPPYSLPERLEHRLLGIAPFSIMPFTTEAGYYKRAGIETVIIGPGDPRYAHSPGERVSISRVIKYTGILERIVSIL